LTISKTAETILGQELDNLCS